MFQVLTLFLIIFSDARVTTELHRGGKHIDVGVEDNDGLIAVEVAMTATHEKVNIEKDIHDAKADFVIVACRDEKVKSAVEKKIAGLSDELKSGVKVCLMGEVLREDSISKIF